MRCVRALAGNPRATCAAPPAGSRRRKCERCSRGGHLCVADPLPPRLQAAVFAAAASGGDVRGALRAQECMPGQRGWAGRGRRGEGPAQTTITDMADSMIAQPS